MTSSVSKLTEANLDKENKVRLLSLGKLLERSGGGETLRLLKKF